MLRALGHAYNDLEMDHGVILPVVHASCVIARRRGTTTRLRLRRGYAVAGHGSEVLVFYIQKAKGAGKSASCWRRARRSRACDDKLNRIPLPEKYVEALKAMMVRGRVAGVSKHLFKAKQAAGRVRSKSDFAKNESQG